MEYHPVGNAGGGTVSLSTRVEPKNGFVPRLRMKLSNSSISYNTSVTNPVFVGPNAHPVEYLFCFLAQNY